jgi:hypothetical protein
MTLEKAKQINKEVLTIWLKILDFLEKESAVSSDEELNYFLGYLRNKIDEV